MKATRTLIVIAKEPRAGRSKTRLQSRFRPVQAARLAEAALTDTLRVVASTPARRRVLVLDGEPGPWLPGGVEVLPQRGAGLDERLAAAFEDAMAGDGHGPALLVGMDTPQLTPSDLDVDWTDLDAVLGLADDGGFWAIGFREPCAGALLGIPMSQELTGAYQLARLESLGLRVGLLRRLTDVDTPADATLVAAQAPGTRFAREHARLVDAAVHPLVLFEACLDGAVVTARDATGERVLGANRWLGDPDSVDELMLSRCEGAVLDVGCGPGRLVVALCRRGTPALGVDVSYGAVVRTTRRGGSVLLRSVQDALPGEGRWGTVLLADGNLGIGGDPRALLRRCADLLRPGGLLLVETDPDTDVDERGSVVLRCEDGRQSRPLPWARMGSRALALLAAELDFSVAEEWRADDRSVLALRSLSAVGRRTG